MCVELATCDGQRRRRRRQRQTRKIMVERHENDFKIQMETPLLIWTTNQ